MVFERKEMQDEQVNSTFWNILKWYWIIVPSIYFLFVVPNMGQGTEAPLIEPGNVFTLIFQLLNLSLGGILTQTSPLEQSRTGAADKILKVAIVQQFLIQNFLGILLAFITWYKLPYKVKPEMVSSEAAKKWHFQPKTLYILTAIVLVVTILAIISQLALV